MKWANLAPHECEHHGGPNFTLNFNGKLNLDLLSMDSWSEMKVQGAIQHFICARHWAAEMYISPVGFTIGGYPSFRVKVETDRIKTMGEGQSLPLAALRAYITALMASASTKVDSAGAFLYTGMYWCLNCGYTQVTDEPHGPECPTPGCHGVVIRNSVPVDS